MQLKKPWETFRDYVLYILEQQVNDLAFTKLSAAARGGSGLFQEENRRAFRASLASSSGPARPGR